MYLLAGGQHSKAAPVRRRGLWWPFGCGERERATAAERSPYAIEMENVTVKFREGLDSRVALDGLSLTVMRGEQVLVQGASGSGKTTLLNVVRGIQPIHDGRIRIRGVDRTRAAKRADGPITHGIGYIPQHLSLPTNLSFMSVASMQARMEGNQPDAAMLDGLMCGFGLSSKLKHCKYVGDLSGGQQARLAVIGNLLAKKDIMLLDEPASALDRESRLRFGEQLGETCRALGTTALVISHDPLPGFPTRELTMEDGKLLPVASVAAAGESGAQI